MSWYGNGQLNARGQDSSSGLDEEATTFRGSYLVGAAKFDKSTGAADVFHPGLDGFLVAAGKDFVHSENQNGEEGGVFDRILRAVKCLIRQPYRSGVLISGCVGDIRTMHVVCITRVADGLESSREGIVWPLGAID